MVIKSIRKGNRKEAYTEFTVCFQSGQQAEPYAYNEASNALCRSPYTNWDQGLPSCLISNLRREDSDICSRMQWAIKPGMVAGILDQLEMKKLNYEGG